MVVVAGGAVVVDGLDDVVEDAATRWCDPAASRARGGPAARGEADGQTDGHRPARQGQGTETRSGSKPGASTKIEAA